MRPTIRLSRALITVSAVALVALALFITACSEIENSSSEPISGTASAEDTPTATIEITAEPDPTSPAIVEAEPTQPTATETNPSGGGNEPTHVPEPEPEPESSTPAPENSPESVELPEAAFLGGMTHMYQTFNNCSAASVCMLLSHFDVVMDQETLRPIMRPNDGTRHGKNEYMIGFFRDQGFEAHLMHGGDVETLKAFIASDIPVIVQQWLEIDADPIGHYSVVRGYDDHAGVFRLNDSMHGEDFQITYEEFTEKWRAFSYRYIPVYPADYQDTVDLILGDEVDLNVNRERTIEQIRAELEFRPGDPELLYALGTNLHDIGRYDEAINAYEQASAIGLPPKMLWYVYWPAEAYNALGRYQEAIQVAETQIASAQTFGDMRYERARALEALGESELAIAEYNAALRDDPKLTRAEEALIRLGAR
jgi:hypothetical protein